MCFMPAALGLVGYTIGYALQRRFRNGLTARAKKVDITTSRAKSTNEIKHFRFRLPHVAPRHDSHFWTGRFCMRATRVTCLRSSTFLDGVKMTVVPCAACQAPKYSQRSSSWQAGM